VTRAHWAGKEHATWHRVIDSSLRRRGSLGILAALLLGSCNWSGTAGTSPSADGLFHWTISTSVEIGAPPARVWSVLVDLPAYSEWNPFIVEAAGTVAVGETLSLRMALPGRNPMLIKPRLLIVEPEHELRWKGQLLLPGLFDGEHAFELTPLDGGRTRLDHSERFAGVLLPIARSLIYDDTVQSFHALDAALAQRAALR
jgi:hypothetical protein